MSKIICGESLDIMLKHVQIPADSVDLLLTDPPYWTLNKWRDIGTTTRLGGNHDKSKQTGWFTTIDEQEIIHDYRAGIICSAGGEAWQFLSL